MAKNTRVIKQLKSKLDDALISATRATEKALRMEERYNVLREKELEREESDRRNIRFRDDRMENLEDQVTWLRKLVENIAIPKETLKMISQEKERIAISEEKRRMPNSIARDYRNL